MKEIKIVYEGGEGETDREEIAVYRYGAPGGR